MTPALGAGPAGSFSQAIGGFFLLPMLRSLDIPWGAPLYDMPPGHARGSGG